MKLPLLPDVEFHKDICLLIHRPRGLLNRVAINKIISLIGELEFTLKKPFNASWTQLRPMQLISIWNTFAAFLFIAGASTAIARP
jgi:hypothetical protein